MRHKGGGGRAAAQEVAAAQKSRSHHGPDLIYVIPAEAGTHSTGPD